MTKNLRIRPLDTAAPGSFRERARILRVYQKVRAEDSDSLEALLELDELVVSRLETTDGSDLEEALAELSIDEARAFVSQLLNTEVPTPSAEN